VIICRKNFNIEDLSTIELGSFEVKCQGTTLYSKLKNIEFPHPQRLADKII